MWLERILYMPSEDENTYVIKDESVELGRLVLQDKLYTQAIGGLFPEIDLTGITRVLDIACGPAGWAIDVAFEFPEMEVVGVDISENIINYNFAQARVRNLQNVTFEVMDARQPFTFQDHSFDLVNGRLFVGFMDTEAWPRLLAECWRILRPGGVVRLTESENGISNSKAFQSILLYFCEALAKQKRTYSVDGRSLGIAYMLPRLLQTAGFQDIQHKAFCVDSSYSTPLHYSTFRNVEAAYMLLKPFILQHVDVSEEEYDQNYSQMLTDIQKEDFTCFSFGLTAWARKPEEG
jgi:ubiquinone/menaquinone biosynthesis C-methylase UbiE